MKEVLALQAGSNQAQSIFDVVNSELITILGTEARRIRFAKNPPTVIMLAGLQGAGKTTLAAKLAKYYKDQGNTPLLVAADLQRPNAVTQLQVLGQQIGVQYAEGFITNKMLGIGSLDAIIQNKT